MKKRMGKGYLKKALVLASLVGASCGGIAATKTWNGGGGADGNWSVGANWGGTAPAATGDALVFSGSSGLLNTNDRVTSAAQLRFNSGGFQVFGNGFTLGGGGITNNAGLNRLAVPLTLTPNKSWLAAANTELWLSGDTTSSGTSGGTIMLYGGGLVRLTGNNNWSRGVDILNGVIMLDGGTITAGDGIRVKAEAGANAIAVVTNNGVWTMTGGANLQLGQAGATSGTNIVNVYSGQLDSAGSGSGGNLNIGAAANIGGTLNQFGGLVRANVDLVLATASGAKGTYNLNGGILEAKRIRLGNTGGTGILNLDGGTIRPGGDNAQFLEGLTAANVMAGGVIFDTAGFNITNNQAFLHGAGATPDGGLTKTGNGYLYLAGANTYNGPTLVNAGTLGLTTLHAGGGSLALADGTSVNLQLSSLGGSISLSGLSLGTSSGATLTFNLGAFGNATAPLIFATNLVAQGLVTLNVSGVGFSVGQFTLIKYEGTIGGDGFGALELVGLPNGVAAELVDNAANNSVDINITSAPSVIWSGAVDGNWDIGLTANWIGSQDSLPATYSEGTRVRFDDSAAGPTAVSLQVNLSPGGVTVSNHNLNYSFSGPGVIGGGGGLVKEGTGALTLNVANTYAANTLISEGLVKIGVNNALPSGAGKGEVVLDGALDLNGFAQSLNGLSGTGSLSNSIGNSSVIVGNNNASGAFTGLITESGGTLALAKTGAGTLTLTGNNNYSGGTTNSAGILQVGHDRALGVGPVTLMGGILATLGGERTLANPITITAGAPAFDTTEGTLKLLGPLSDTGNFDPVKLGDNSLIIQGGAYLDADSGWNINRGYVVVDGCQATNSHDGNRIRADNGTFAGLIITNNASYTMGTIAGSPNFRLGNTANQTGTNLFHISSGEWVMELTGREILVGDLAGTTGIVHQTGGIVRWTNNNSSTIGVVLGSNATAFGVYNLDGGELRTPRVRRGAGTGYFHFNGGTLSPSANLYASTFMAGLTEVTIKDGGAIIDTAGIDITIPQPLLAGGAGGLTKNGEGTLNLTGLNTYTGPTVVNEGALRVRNSYVGGGAFTVADGATLEAEAPSLGDTLRTAGLTLGSGNASTKPVLTLRGQASAAPLIHATNLVLVSPVVLNLNVAGLQLGHQVPLIKYETYLENGGWFDVINLPPGVQGEIVDNFANSTIDLLVTGVTPLVWTGGGADWDIGISVNWTNALTQQVETYLEPNGIGAAVLFNDLAPANTNVNITTTVSPGALLVAGSANNYAFSGAGKISGPGGLVKEGSTTLILGTANDFTGLVEIKGGTLIAGNNSALGTVDNGTVVYDGATLDVNNKNLGAENITISGAGFNGVGALINTGAEQQNSLRYVTLAGDATVGGTGRFDIRGATNTTLLSTLGQPFTLTKTGNNQFSLVNVLVDPALGDIDVRQGILSFEVETTSQGDPTRTLTIHSNASVMVWRTFNPLNKVIVMKDGSRLYSHSSAAWTNYVTGPITVESGLARLDANYLMDVSGPITGLGGINKVGTSTLVLRSANSFAGGFILTTGRVEVAHDQALGTGLVSLGGGVLASDGLTARTITNNLLVTTGSTLGDAVNAGQLEFTGVWDFSGGARGLTVSSPVVMSGGSTNGRLTKLGASVLTLRGLHQWNGEAEVRVGTLIVEGIVTNTGAFRPDCSSTANARLVIANGGLAVYDGTGANFRVGNDGNTTATNYLDIAGAIRTPTANTSNGRIFIGGGGTKGVVTLLPGGDAEVRTVAKDGTAGYAQFNFNGGVLRAMGSTNNFIQGLDLALVQDGGAIIDTAGYDLTIAQPLLAGGTGGLTKNGLGTLTLTGANTYTGPTVVNGGTLVVSSSQNPGHAFAAVDGATLRFIAVPSTTLSAGAVTAGTNAGGVLAFDIGLNASPTVPVVNAGTFTVNGTATINVLGQNNGGNFPVGQRITLLTYTSASGLAGLQLGALPAGVAGTLDHNVANSSVDLVITGSARALKWGGEISAAWDINTTVNWTNLFTGFWDVYLDDGNFGDGVLFDGNAANRHVNVTTDVRPYAFEVNSAPDYDIGGDGKIGGSVTLVKNGAGALTLSSANSYTGGTLVNGGALRLGHDGALGAGALQMTGGALSSDGVDARTITNAAKLAGDLTLGDALLNGPLTLAGPLDLAGAGRTLTLASDVTWSGLVTNGFIANQQGPGTLIFSGPYASMNGIIHIRDGAWVINGCAVTNNEAVRLFSTVPNGLARLVITNGGSLDITLPSANLRPGYSPGGDTSATNVVDLAGRLTLVTGGNGGQVQIGASSARSIVNLLAGGVLETKAVTHAGGASEFNFNGGLLRPLDATLAGAFMQGLTAANVRDGGAIIDTAGLDLTIAQPLLAGGAGGLTKLGAGTLNLTGNSTYTGLTVVSNGVLGGTGSLLSPTLIEAAGALNPGNAGIGTLTINNTLSLAGTTVLELNRTNAQNADLVTGITTLTAGGTLVITNLGPTLQVGDTFNLFDAATFAGGFASIILPDLPTTEWKWNTNNLMVNGTIAVAPTNAPPVAQADGFAAVVNQSTRVAIAKLLTNDYDPEGGALTFLGNFATNNGSVAIDGDHLVYTPANGFTGLDTFTYVIADDLGAQSVGLVSIMVTVAPVPGQNQLGAPVFEPGTATVRFAGIPGRDYILLRALAVEGPWSPVRTNTAPAHGLIEFTDPAAPGPGAFYKTMEKP